MADYPDFRKPVSIAQQEVDLDTVIQACNVVISTSVKTVEATINQIITGQTIDLTQQIVGQTVGVYDRRDWASKELEYKTWAQIPVPIAAGQKGESYIYEVPSGKVLFITDVHAASSVKGYEYLYAAPGLALAYVFLGSYDSKIISYGVPLPVTAGALLRTEYFNKDTEDGDMGFLVIGWEQPASVPKKPQSDDPLEHYKLGEFNFAEVLNLPEAETLLIFGKAKTSRKGYLRIKNIYKPDEKVLASFWVPGPEVTLIRDNIRVERHKTKEVLEEFEKKYKKEK